MVGHYTSQQSMCLRCRRTVTARLGNNVLCSLYSSLSHHAHNSFLFFCQYFNRWPCHLVTHSTHSLTHSRDDTLLKHRVTPETCNLWDIQSEWWIDMTWEKKTLITILTILTAIAILAMFLLTIYVFDQIFFTSWFIWGEELHSLLFTCWYHLLNLKGVLCFPLLKRHTLVTESLLTNVSLSECRKLRHGQIPHHRH